MAVVLPPKLRTAKPPDAALGLTLIEAENTLAKSIVRHKTFHLPTILSEKKHISGLRRCRYSLRPT